MHPDNRATTALHTRFILLVEFPAMTWLTRCGRNRLLRMSWRFLLPIALLILSGVAIDSTIRLRYPAEDMGKDSLPERRKAQLAAAHQFEVFHQFQFSDRLKQSGITFQYHAVDDITKHMRMGHYDHGSAVAVADVDGDGLYDIYFVNQAGGNEL